MNSQYPEIEPEFAEDSPVEDSPADEPQVAKTRPAKTPSAGEKFLASRASESPGGETSSQPSPLGQTSTVKRPFKRSFFQSDKSAPAQKIELYGEVFYFDPLTDDAREEYESASSKIAQKLGLSDDEYRALPVEFFNLEQNKIRIAAEHELFDVVLCDALRDWSLPVPCNDKYKRDLHLDLKRDLAEMIVSFSIHGVSEARFRKAIG